MVTNSPIAKYTKYKVRREIDEVRCDAGWLPLKKFWKVPASWPKMTCHTISQYALDEVPQRNAYRHKRHDSTSNNGTYCTNNYNQEIIPCRISVQSSVGNCDRWNVQLPFHNVPLVWWEMGICLFPILDLSNLYYPWVKFLYSGDIFGWRSGRVLIQLLFLSHDFIEGWRPVVSRARHWWLFHVQVHFSCRMAKVSAGGIHGGPRFQMPASFYLLSDY